MNITGLIGDVEAEVTAATTFIKGVEKLVTDAKAQGLTSVTITDLEALVPEVEAAFADGEKIATNI
jgi:hypothetical protein